MEKLEPAHHEDVPLIGDSQSLPEITCKVVVLSILLTVILTAANAYLGLKVGMTISASIPAAVIGMAILRLFRQSNVLEINIVQSAASSGEALTAGMAFTIPALLVIQYWTDFDYITTFFIAALGGVLGVFFSVPLRKILLADKHLHFPEGTAIGQVLKISTKASAEIGISHLIYAGVFGAAVSIFQMGFKILANNVQYWVYAGKMVLGFSVGFSPTLIGAGYIMGANAAASVLVGVIVGWFIAIPILSLCLSVDPSLSAADAATFLWQTHVRYIGIGVMMVGSVWAGMALLRPLFRNVKNSLRSVTKVDYLEDFRMRRTERDIPLNVVVIGVIGSLVPIYLLLFVSITQAGLGLTVLQQALLSNLSLLFVLFGGLAFAAICAYFAGLVGSSASPITSIILVALILISSITMILLNFWLDIDYSDRQLTSAAAYTIIVTAIVAAVAAISNDTMQDMKAGKMVGATPWKQQLMLLVGVLTGALVIPLVLQLLFHAYGLVGVPDTIHNPAHMLAAPQAGLIAAVSEGIFTGGVNWQMMLVGVIIALFVLIVDKKLRQQGYQLPVLAVGIGIYFPLDTSSALVMGGMFYYFLHREVKKRRQSDDQNILEQAEHKGILIACGLVAGAAIMGVLLAIPFVLAGGNSEILRIIPSSFDWVAHILIVIVTLALLAWFRHRVVHHS
jgi:putative OPT family oligopeptide transporter